MALSEKQKQHIIFIDSAVTQILSDGGGEEDILAFLPDVMTNDFRDILTGSTANELDTYVEKYEGFRVLMQFLEELADRIADEKSRNSNVGLD